MDERASRTTRLPDDPQVDAALRASGITRAEADVFVAELAKIGWAVRSITGPAPDGRTDGADK